MNLCLLGLGSNLNSPKRQLYTAIKAIKHLPKTNLLLVAPYYKNRAWGKKAVPDYYNTVALIHTGLPCLTLLSYCQAIEKKQNRVQRVKNAARPIDIDLLDYANLTMQHPKLTLPHPRMHERDFVQVPLKFILKKLALTADYHAYMQGPPY